MKDKLYKKAAIALLLAIFTFTILSEGCKKDNNNSLNSNGNIKEYKQYDVRLTNYIYKRSFYYLLGKIDHIRVFDEESSTYGNVDFFYKNNKIDYYTGFMWGAGGTKNKKQYYYNSNGFIDSVVFESVINNGLYKIIELNRDSNQHINYYKITLTAGEKRTFHYKWDGDNIIEKNEYLFDSTYTPQLLI